MTLTGSRVRITREKCGLSQAKLADAVGVDNNTVSRWERGLFKITLDYIPKLAIALGTTSAYLLGETDDPNPRQGRIIRGTRFDSADEPPIDYVEDYDTGAGGQTEGKTTPIPTDPAGWKKLPLYSKMMSACGGRGNGLEYVESEIEGWHYLPAEIYGSWDNERPPFMCYVQGDSMEDALIHDGAMIIVNPAEEAWDGESVLVCWDNDQVAVKLLYRLKGGGVELHAASPENKKVYTFSKDDIDTGRVDIKGKVMWSGQRPKRMR